MGLPVLPKQSLFNVFDVTVLSTLVISLQMKRLEKYLVVSKDDKA